MIMKMEVVKLAYFIIVLYCWLASYSEALPYKSRAPEGKNYCINYINWILSKLHTLLLMILSKIVYVCIFCFQSVGRVHIMGQVKLVIVWNVLFKETKRIQQNGHGRFLYSKEKKVCIKMFLFVYGIDFWLVRFF